MHLLDGLGVRTKTLQYNQWKRLTAIPVAAQVQDWPSQTRANGIEPYVRLEESNVSCVQGLVVRLLFHELLRHLLLLIYQSICGRATLYSRMFICSHSIFVLCLPSPQPRPPLLACATLCRHIFLLIFLYRSISYNISCHIFISGPWTSSINQQQHARLGHPLRCPLGPPRPLLRLPRFWYDFNGPTLVYVRTVNRYKKSDGLKKKKRNLKPDLLLSSRRCLHGHQGPEHLPCQH
jgi:hypothetical protein